MSRRLRIAYMHALSHSHTSTVEWCGSDKLEHVPATRRPLANLFYVSNIKREENHQIVYPHSHCSYKPSPIVILFPGLLHKSIPLWTPVCYIQCSCETKTWGRGKDGIDNVANKARRMVLVVCSPEGLQTTKYSVHLHFTLLGRYSMLLYVVISNKTHHTDGGQLSIPSDGKGTY